MSSITEASQTAAPARSQYHHFVPRFILKNFAHLYQSPDEAASSSKSSTKPVKRNRKRGKKKKGPIPGDLMLNVINLKGDNACIEEIPVATTLGVTDMYRDEREQNQKHLEERLSKLESVAAMVMHKMRKAFEAGSPDVWITRSERDTLRKFLFIMKYRGSGFHRRYFHQTAEEYSEDDRQKLQDYMHKKGYEKPVDVWFDNIKAMVDLRMDPQMQWKDLLMESIIHEGPVSILSDPDTQKIRQGAYTEFHNFAGISPRLMIVLRSFVLPVLDEDANEEIGLWRQNCLEQIAAQHGNPIEVRSLFEDLRITKARNTYTRIANGELEFLDGEDGVHRLHDKFCFPFFPISTKHTDWINFIMLENAHHILTIVFNSRKATDRTMQRYLTTPCEVNGQTFFKYVESPEPNLQLKFLEKLDNVFGNANRGLVYTCQSKDLMDPLGTLGQMMQAEFPRQENPTGLMQLYNILGGSIITLPKDLDQAKKMLNMRIKIDVWSNGLDEIRRQEFRDQMARLFWQLPARRVWLYLKSVRFRLRPEKEIAAAQRVDISQLSIFDQSEHAEDVIVKASHLVRVDQVNKLMWVACMSELCSPKIFGIAGSISDCGINAVEKLAPNCREMVLLTEAHEDFPLPRCTTEQSIEFHARCGVRGKYEEIFGASAAEPAIKALWEVLDKIYPRYPDLLSHHG
ncbi:MAG: hypothetical protein OHK93_003878 [Ramalina farinacea]|uniref:DUF4238 domain-containing protein n=1 Tax=Ramalina farinacea TaxID=258253 RepID=A0AA43QHZ6_9LECA|nr:hypothetical protein [Ramalina farinacea]